MVRSPWPETMVLPSGETGKVISEGVPADARDGTWSRPTLTVRSGTAGDDGFSSGGTATKVSHAVPLASAAVSGRKFLNDERPSQARHEVLSIRRNATEPGSAAWPEPKLRSDLFGRAPHPKKPPIHFAQRP